MSGSLSLVLHAHLPFVRHPEHPEFLEEDWLFEAITETYLPLLLGFTQLADEGVPFRLTMSLTPPLCEMLADPLLQQRYLRHLERLLELAEGQALARCGTPFQAAADHAARELARIHHAWVHTYRGQLLPAFRALAERGHLTLVTCTATHGLLPLMATEEARHAQVEVACRSYERHFGRRPEGIWLAECAWAPGLDRLLSAAGLRFFFCENRALTEATPPARLGAARPVLTPAGVAAFARDPACSQQVWSSEVGYPGDPAYREFYRDVGYDMAYEEIRPWLHSDGVRRNVGLKYHRITGKVDLSQKAAYDPTEASRRARAHAADFVASRRAQLAGLKRRLGTEAHLTAPFDAELFGHWWYEGPQFLCEVLRLAAADEGVELTTPDRYLARRPALQQTVPAASTWGANGTYEVWLNGGNDWIYRHLHRAEERMVELVSRFPDAVGLTRRALDQAARELLLAQSSDWAFIITMDTSVPYAEKRTRDHLHRFLALAEQLESGSIDAAELAGYEDRDNIFREIDYRLWHPAACRRRGGALVWSTEGEDEAQVETRRDVS